MSLDKIGPWQMPATFKIESLDERRLRDFATEPRSFSRMGSAMLILARKASCRNCSYNSSLIEIVFAPTCTSVPSKARIYRLIGPNLSCPATARIKNTAIRVTIYGGTEYF